MNKIMVIVGPTGIGKTKLSVELAKRIDAEIINADSVSIYKELNIGSAKPSIEERCGIVHHMIDICDINDEYNVFNYQSDGRKVIEDIKSRNKNIIIVGGTGLYIKGLLFDYKFDSSDGKDKLLYPSIFIGLDTDRDLLYKRINDRVDYMINNGLLDEVNKLRKYDNSSRILNSAIGYKEFNMNLELDDTIDLIKKNSRHYAKRQYTFFRNQFDIKWFNVDFDNFNNTIEEVYEYINKNYKK